MHLKIGPIPESTEFLPDDSWRPIREPSPWQMQMYAFPIGLSSAAVLAFLWLNLTPIGISAFGSFLEPGMFLWILVSVIVVHELLHAISHPGNGSSRYTVVGFWPAKIVFYAHYDGELSRNRFLAILVAPTVVISIIPLIVLALVKVPSALLAWVSAWNAFLACCDILGVFLLLAQVPSGARVRNKGWRTYWKPFSGDIDGS